MNHELLSYYESELQFIREMGKEFAKEFPGVAGRLMIGESDAISKDPHVERLIEAFALIAGNIRHKIDDEFPEITESFIEVLYPHYIRPIPSMATAQFSLDPLQAKSTGGHHIPRHSQLFTRPLKDLGAPCKFQTGYDVTLWPLEVLAASILTPGQFPAAIPAERAVAAIRLDLRCHEGASLQKLGLNHLRFYLGDDSFVYTLHELLLNSVSRTVLVDAGRSTRPAYASLREDCLRPVGFDQRESLLPYPERSFIGYRVLQEYFSFPRKHLFFDVCGFDRLTLERFGERFALLFYLKDFERRERLDALVQGIKAENFRLGCTPIINLFKKDAEPISLTHTQREYQLIPDVYLRSATEVYSVDKVTSTGGYFAEPREYEPFYSLRHNYDDDPAQAYWYPSRRPSLARGDEGTDVYLAFVDLDFKPAQPADEAIAVKVTCTNRDVPSKLQVTHEPGELWMESQPLVKCRFVTKPTKPQRPPLRSGLQWRLISHLSLNQLSLGGIAGTSDPRNPEALREILRLYNYSNDSALGKQIEGIVAVKSQPHMAPITSPQGVVFALGTRVEIEFEESHYVGGSAFLMASMLERFLALYSAVNSFSQLVARTTQRKGILREWKPRAGEQIVL